MTNYAVAIKLIDSISHKCHKAWQQINEHFNIHYISDRCPYPHLTLAAGQFNIDETTLITSIQYCAQSIKPFQITATGTAILSNQQPLLYIRWQLTPELQHCHSVLDTCFNIHCIKPEAHYNQWDWIPKTTLAYQDLSTEDLSAVSTLLKPIAFTDSMYVDQLQLLTYSVQGETHRASFDLA